MAYFYSLLKAAIQATADALGRAPKLALGSLGEMEFPTSGLALKVRDTGQLWTTGETPIDLVLQEVGEERDGRHPDWAVIATSATGIAPTYFGSDRISGVSKNEGANSITVNYTPNWLAVGGSPAYVVSAHPLSTACCQDILTWQVDLTTMQFMDVVAHVPLGINDRTILFFAMGRV